jgi:hypothetical protein
LTILAIRTGLFPAADALDDALALVANPSRRFVSIDLAREDLKDDDWDAALAAILAADLVFTC